MNAGAPPAMACCFLLVLGGCESLMEPSAGPDSEPDLPECSRRLDCELPPAPSSGDPHQDCVDRINQFRSECACLPPLERWSEGEACAAEHAEYDSTRAPHSGFRARICPNSGLAQNECPSWPSTASTIDRCLQLMWDEGPPPERACSGECFEAHGHFINMASQRYGRVACSFFTAPDGEVWSVQNFAP